RNGDADVSGFAAIPQVGEKAQHTRKFNMIGELHVVPIDLETISLDFVSRVNLNQLVTYPTAPNTFTTYGYTPDQWTVGAALRSKVATDAVTRALNVALRRLPANQRPSLRFQPF